MEGRKVLKYGIYHRRLHANFRKFSSRRFKAQKQMTRDDFVIVCGDFGGIWKDDERERYWLNWLAQKPFTLLFVDGNHENFDRLYSNEDCRQHLSPDARLCV